MKATVAKLVFVSSLTLATVTSMATAHAQGEGGGGAFGVGAAAMLPQAFGASPPLPAAAMSYDAGAWHLDGLLGLSNDANDDALRMLAGVRFFYHLHQSSSADFSLGGGLGFSHLDRDGGPGDRDDTSLLFEGGAQIRVFIVSNVAVTGSTGLGIRVGDDDEDGFVLGGQLLSSLGIIYFFR